MNTELENILSRVAGLYLKYGIKSITMDDVARELAISKKTLYQYFEDKNDLVRKTIEWIINEKGNLLEKIYASGMNAIDELIELNKTVAKMMREHSPVCDFDLRKYYPDTYQLIRTVKRSRMYESIYGNMLRGKEQGLYRDDLNAEVIAKLHVSHIESLMETEIFSIEELVSMKVYQQIFTYHIRGIANEKGVAYFEKKQNELNAENN
jgi:AcrR family transcriptional regulator